MKLLHIENDLADHLLVTRRLERDGLQAEIHRVDVRPELAAALESGGWQAVLLDYDVPGLNFWQTLEFLRQRLPDTPVILVSGAVGEERAVEMIRQGVWDCVLKDNLTRLRSALERSLREAAGRRAKRAAEEALRESEARFQATFEQAAVGIAMVATDGRWLKVNQKLCTMLGRSPAEMLGLGVSDITHADDLVADLDSEARMLSCEIQSYATEKRFMEKGAGPFWVRVTVSLVWKDDASPDYFIHVVEDIQERKDAEAALKVRG